MDKTHSGESCQEKKENEAAIVASDDLSKLLALVRTSTSTWCE
jgi:hypothetical protein